MINEPLCISLDEKTKSLLDKYGEQHSLSRSAVLRMIVNDFFLKKDGN